MDKDEDGNLDRKELWEAVSEFGVTHESFDEEHEVVGALEDVSIASKGETIKRWVALASLMSPGDVGDWMEHAVGLPDRVALSFVKANWTGSDLPVLLKEDGAFEELKKAEIELTKAELVKLTSAIKLRMLHVGSTPFLPEFRETDTKQCARVALAWSSKRVFPEVHKYRLFRRKSKDGPPELDDPWEVIFEGRTTAFSDRRREFDSGYDYRLEAWNLVGRSEAAELHDVLPLSKDCTAGLNSMRVVWTLILGGALVSVAGFVGTSYFTKQQHRNNKKKTSRRRSHRTSISNNDSNNLPTAIALQDLCGELAAAQRFGDSSGDEATDLVSNTIGGVGPHDNRMLNRSQSASVDLPPLNYENGAFSQSSDSSRRRFQNYESDKCFECSKKISHLSRHNCGGCLRTFCLEHTAIHPHTELAAPMFGKIVLSSCGVNSKCRCYGCAGMVMDSYVMAAGSKVFLSKSSHRRGERGEEKSLTVAANTSFNFFRTTRNSRGGASKSNSLKVQNGQTVMPEDAEA